MIIEVIHAGEANVSKARLSEMVASKLKTDQKNVVLYGFRTAFGGGRSTGFGLVYNDQKSRMSYEPKHRLRKAEILPKKASIRKSMKELKKKIKKTRGKERCKHIAQRKNDKRATINKLKADYLKNLKN